MKEPVIAFLPCRKGSERAPRKNIRPFASFEHGLVEIKLAQLLTCPAVERVVLSTNDDEIIDFSRSLRSPKLSIHQRSDALSASTTSTDDLVKHARDLIGSGHILWTHVTSPFVGTRHYLSIIEAYRDALSMGYDSLMTATPTQAFLWDGDGPINYSRRDEKWPRTQTLKKLYEINSAAFLASAETYAKYEDRIGERPLIYSIDRAIAMDIDWEEDFLIAEQCFLGGICSPGLGSGYISEL